MAEVLELKHQPDLVHRVKAIQEEGFTYFPEALKPTEISELKMVMDELTPIKDQYGRMSRPENPNALDKHIINAFNHDPIFLQYLDRPEVIDLAEALHGDNCHIIGMTAWVTGPGRADQKLHCDWLPLELPEDILADPRVKTPVFISTTHYYLDDVYEELGPTKFIPGSHLSGKKPGEAREWKGETEKSIICNAGDAVTFRSEVWHRGSANHSNENRYLLQVHYAHRMISQHFPPFMNKFQFDQDIISMCSPKQKRLLGDHVNGAYD